MTTAELRSTGSTELVHGPAPEAPRRGGLAPRVLRTVLEHIEAHLGDDLGLDQLAGIAGVCPDFLVRAFRQSTGVPPHRYVVARRVARAQALLRARTGSISVIALRAGFGTPSSFTRAFHRTTGLTPREFQRQGEAGASHELQGQRVSLA